ncbi:MAG: ABC transporter substrate-binding protein [Dehalococcoidia bacterium]
MPGPPAALSLRLALAAAALLVVAGCSGSAPTPTPPPTPAPSLTTTPSPTPTPTLPATSQPRGNRGGVLRVWIDTDPASLDLSLRKDPNAWAVMLPMMGWLVANDQAGRGVTPDLAERWKVTAATELVFHLNPRVRWRDGSRLGAEDEVVSLTRLSDGLPSAPYHRPMAAIAAVEALDDFTVRVTLRRPDPTFLAGLVALGPAPYARVHTAEVVGLSPPLHLEDGPSYRLERVWLAR